MRLRGLSVALLGTLLCAETFESLTFTPPTGWATQNAPDGRVYIGQAANGSAIIAVYSSQPGNPAVADLFAAYWRAHVEKALPGPVPQPQFGKDGDYAFAVGTKQIIDQGSPVNATLVAFVGRGRMFGALGVAKGEDLNRAMISFFGSLRLAGSAPATTSSAKPVTGEPEVDFDLPPGYVSRREGSIIVLSPVDEKQNPCTYGITPPRPSKGSLDADAESALLDLYPGWQRMNNERKMMRGTSDAGWQYFWNKAYIWEGPSAFAKRASAMSMAISAGTGRVNIVVGKGTVFCTFDDPSSVKLIQGLRPRGWTSDGGKALARDILGNWRWTNGFTGANALMQYGFQPDGTFTSDLGSTTRTGVLETTATSTRDGQYSLRGNELTLTRATGRKTYRVRLYEEFDQGSWRRIMSLLDESVSPQAMIEYFRVD